jgi:hypothetical protein
MRLLLPIQLALVVAIRRTIMGERKLQSLGDQRLTNVGYGGGGDIQRFTNGLI